VRDFFRNIAALYPAPSSYLYFVAQPHGKHVFSAVLRRALGGDQARAAEAVRAAEATARAAASGSAAALRDT
jgi:hypothetical protein